jgi:hypothetical protein
MSEHRTTHYAAESERNAWIVVKPINDRLREAGWVVVSSVWSDNVPGFWEEEFKGQILAHASAGGALTIVYEHNPVLPVLPSLRAAIEAAAIASPDVEEDVRKLARIAREDRFTDFNAPRGTFMGEYLAGALQRPDLAEAYQAIPARLRLEMERADADEFIEKYAV